MSVQGDQHERLLREDEAARILGLSPKTLRRWRFPPHGIPFIKLAGGAVRYRRADIEEFIQNGRIEPTPAG